MVVPDDKKLGLSGEEIFQSAVSLLEECRQFVILDLSVHEGAQFGKGHALWMLPQN